MFINLRKFTAFSRFKIKLSCSLAVASYVVSDENTKPKFLTTKLAIANVHIAFLFYLFLLLFKKLKDRLKMYENLKLKYSLTFLTFFSSF
jgi:hypothetical protein